MVIWGSVGFLIGIILGSFTKVLADRSLIGKYFKGRSYCLFCKTELRWYDLFPIFSYILLAGKCRYCKKKIGMEYLLVEVAVGLLVGFLFFQSFQGLSPLQFQISNFKFQIKVIEVLLNIFFIAVLTALFLTDLKKMFIPDRVILPAIVVGAVSLFLFTIYKIGYLYFYLSQTPVGRYLLPPHSDYFQRHALITAQPFLLSILMGLAIGGFFLSLIIITRGKGMGGGDVKLGAFIGLMLGFPNALVALILSFLTGAVFSVGLILLGKKHFGQTIPFGPFLVLGSLIMLYWGSQIIDWYLHLGQ
ncbi:prepilin peptidase [Candidatus Daviesbacteria bacterium]|nr:prepilin peptidase [Candidatus Daviesbacteria bacterium]